MTIRRIISDYVLASPEEFPREYNQTQDTQIKDDDSKFREYIFNALQNLQSKMKPLTFVVGNSNNYTAIEYFGVNQKL
jgi:hypothetical protein